MIIAYSIALISGFVATLFFRHRLRKLERKEVAVNLWGLKLVDELGRFMHEAATANRPMTTQIAIKFDDETDLPVLHLWATADEQHPAARCRVLAAEVERLKARIAELESKA